MRDTYNDAELLKHSMQLHSLSFLNLDVNGRVGRELVACEPGS